MKKVSKVILSMFLALSVSLNLCIPTFASDRMPIETYESSRDDAPQEVKDLVAKLISFYGDEYTPDVIKHLADLKEISQQLFLVTGGVEKNGWTEGRRIRDWLVENGIDEDRIIVEEKAPDTAGNAANSFEILYKDYDVDTVSLITTQYHLKRGSILCGIIT